MPFRWVLPLLLAAGLASPANAARPYTVDDLLRLEEFGKVRFDPAGERLIFERYGRYDAQPDFGREFAIGELQSKVFVADLRSESAPKLLFRQSEGDGYTLLGLSPDGRRAAIGHLSAKGLRPGVVTLDGADLEEVNATPGFSPVRDAVWVGEEVVMSALPPGRFNYTVSIRAELVDALQDQWRDMRAGKVPTASALGSGRFANFPGLGGRLVAFGGGGDLRKLAEGTFTDAYASPDGQRIAAIREDHLTLDPKKPIEHGANIGGVQHALLVYRADGTGAVEPCVGCDVIGASVGWSPSGRKLAFFARAKGQEWSAATFYVLDVQTGRSAPISVAGYTPHQGRAGGLQIEARSAWIGEKLAILADQADAGTRPDRDRRADWILLGRAPRNLTRSIAGDTPNLVATTGNSLVLLQDGKVWRATPDGKVVRLAGDVAPKLWEYRAPTLYGEGPHGVLQPQRTATFLERRDDGSVEAVVFVDLASGRTESLTAPDGTSTVAAIAPETRRVAALVRDHEATDLVVIGPDGSRRLLMEVNTHLKDVAPAIPVRIDHKGPKGDLRHSWLLLPPAYRKGDRLPTVVNVYPGAGSHETFTQWRTDTLNALNDQVLVGKGYAVLYPSIPVEYEKVPRDPMTGLVDEVFSAVDAAVAAGYVDGDRLAVQGQSYGGYTTGALIGLTDRFKTAVAQAGLYDLVSAYGTFDQRRRLQLPYVGLDLFAASLSETSQLGMGSPPWKDPERYLRNSPLMHVQDVHTPVLLINGDLDYVPTTQSEEFFTALTRLGKDAEYVRYYGEDHVFHSPANIRDMWARILDWYGRTLGSPTPASSAGGGAR